VRHRWLPERRADSAVDVISVIECAKGNGEITCQRSDGSFVFLHSHWKELLLNIHFNAASLYLLEQSLQLESRLLRMFPIINLYKVRSQCPSRNFYFSRLSDVSKIPAAGKKEK
jgi:hypothetical protein